MRPKFQRLTQRIGEQRSRLDTGRLGTSSQVTDLEQGTRTSAATTARTRAVTDGANRAEPDRALTGPTAASAHAREAKSSSAIAVFDMIAPHLIGALAQKLWHRR